MYMKKQKCYVDKIGENESLTRNCKRTNKKDANQETEILGRKF
jgi:hypothetical protein